MNNNVARKRKVRPLVRISVSVAMAVLAFLFPQTLVAQQKLPTLTVIGSKSIDRIDGLSGIVNTEITLLLTNVTPKTITVFGHNFNGTFSPIGSNYSVDPGRRQIIFADQTKPILRTAGIVFTASEKVKPGRALRYNIFLNGGKPSCLNGLAAIVWLRIGAAKKIRTVISAPLYPCNPKRKGSDVRSCDI